MFIEQDGIVNIHLRIGHNGPYLNKDGSHKFKYNTGTSYKDVMRNFTTLKDEATYIATHQPWQTRKFTLPANLLPVNIATNVRKHKVLEQSLAKIGRFCTYQGIRCSTPIITLDTMSFEVGVPYLHHWATIGSAMGYRGSNNSNSDDFCIPVMIDNFSDFHQVWGMLNQEAKNLIAIMYVGDDGIRGTFKLAKKYGVRPIIDLHHHWVQTGKWLKPGDKISGEKYPLRGCINLLWPTLRPTVRLGCPSSEYFGAKDLAPRRDGDWSLPKHNPQVGEKLNPTIWNAGLIAYMWHWLCLDFDLTLESPLANLCVSETFENIIAFGNAIKLKRVQHGQAKRQQESIRSHSRG